MYIVFKLFLQVVKGFRLHCAYKSRLGHMRGLLGQFDSSGDFFGAFGKNVEYFELVHLLDVFDTEN